MNENMENFLLGFVMPVMALCLLCMATLFLLAILGSIFRFFHNRQKRPGPLSMRIARLVSRYFGET